MYAKKKKLELDKNIAMLYVADLSMFTHLVHDACLNCSNSVNLT